MDFVLCILPKVLPTAPTSGVGVLKSHLEAAGFTAKILDWNVSLYNALDEDEKEGYISGTVAGTENGENIWNSYSRKPYGDRNFINFRKFTKKYRDAIDGWIFELKELKPKWIGLSLLAWRTSSSFAVYMCERIRKNIPDAKIVLGGTGIEASSCKVYKELGLIDHWIFGDAENSLIELMKGNMKYPGIDSLIPGQLHDLDQMMLPNYDDIDWSLYKEEEIDTGFKGGVAHVTGSRGCVRNCDFCDVNRLWPKYRFRSSEKIFEEMVMYKEKYNRTLIHFNDSLINGSMKTYRELMKIISSDPRAEGLRWHSQFIIRSERQMTPEDWELTSKANPALLEIGVESFSQKVREDMEKGFTNDDYWYTMNMIKKYEIPTWINILFGYPTETEEDHEINLDSLRRMYKDGYSPLIRVLPVSTFGMSRDEKAYQKYKSELTGGFWDWEWRGNTERVRKRRQLEFLELQDSLETEYGGPGLFSTGKQRLTYRRKERELGYI